MLRGCVRVHPCVTTRRSRTSAASTMAPGFASAIVRSHPGSSIARVPDDDAVGAVGEQALDVVARADAAADLDGHRRVGEEIAHDRVVAPRPVAASRSTTCSRWNPYPAQRRATSRGSPRRILSWSKSPPTSCTTQPSRRSMAGNGEHGRRARDEGEICPDEGQRPAPNFLRDETARQRHCPTRTAAGKRSASCVDHAVTRTRRPAGRQSCSRSTRCRDPQRRTADRGVVESNSSRFVACARARSLVTRP